MFYPHQQQDPRIANSSTFNAFLLAAQQETRHEQAESVSLDIYLMNEHKVTLSILTTEQTDSVLEKACSLLAVPEELVYCFALFLIRRDEDGDITVLRKLQDFESPYISQKALADSAYANVNTGMQTISVVDPKLFITDPDQTFERVPGIRIRILLVKSSGFGTDLFPDEI
jgi:hypothetical protein